MPRFRSYVICGTPRSGSTLLCDMLEGTGVAGRPASYFRHESIQQWRRRLNVPLQGDVSGSPIDCNYVDAVARAGRGGTDIFGMRLMWENAGSLLMRLGQLIPGQQDHRERLERAFGPMLFIHLSRTDKVAQAVSLIKAMQTGLWHVASDGTERERTHTAHDASYDRDSIGRYVDELTEHDQAWTRWFDENGIKPVSLTYETLSAKPSEALEVILSALELDPSIAATVKPRSTRMSDGESQIWVERFRAETGAQRV